MDSLKKISTSKDRKLLLLRKGKEMGQLADVAVVLHILLDASTTLPMTFLNKIEFEAVSRKKQSQHHPF